MNRDDLTAWSRFLHKNIPPNLFYHEKVPYKTIFIAFIFLLVGTFFLWWGGSELYHKGDIMESYEKLIIGFIMFIPGSYHSFLAFMVFRGMEGYNYENLTVFESEEFFYDD